MGKLTGREDCVDTVFSVVLESGNIKLVKGRKAINLHQILSIKQLGVKVMMLEERLMVLNQVDLWVTDPRIHIDTTQNMVYFTMVNLYKARNLQLPIHTQNTKTGSKSLLKKLQLKKATSTMITIEYLISEN